MKSETWLQCSCGLFCGTIQDWKGHAEATKCLGYHCVKSEKYMSATLEYIKNINCVSQSHRSKAK